MKSMFVRSILLAAGVWFAAPVNAIQNADPRFDTCNGCTQQQVEAQATQRFVISMVEVHIGDYAAGNLWSCEVVRELELQANFSACGPATPEAQFAFREVANLVAALKQTVELPYPGGNIYSIAGCPACAVNWLLDYQHSLARQLSLASLLHAAGLRLSVSVGVPSASVTASYEGQVRVKLVLSNDSANARGKGYCIGALTNTELTVDVNQCVDGDGNPIPTLQNPLVQNRYQFISGSNHQNMIGRLRAVGQPVRAVGPGVVTVGSIECTGTDCATDEPPPDDRDGN